MENSKNCTVPSLPKRIDFCLSIVCFVLTRLYWPRTGGAVLNLAGAARAALDRCFTGYSAFSVATTSWRADLPIPRSAPINASCTCFRAPGGADKAATATTPTTAASAACADALAADGADPAGSAADCAEAAALDVSIGTLTGLLCNSAVQLNAIQHMAGSRSRHTATATAVDRRPPAARRQIPGGLGTWLVFLTCRRRLG